jgi:hypothetical protein
MEDSLNILMSDYLSNPVINKLNFDKETLIEAIKLSEKFTYDQPTDLIKLKYRPKRKTIVFRDIPKEHQKEEKFLEIFDLSRDKNYREKIVKIEELNGLFFVYFNDEETTLEIFKWIEKIKEDKNVKFFFNDLVNSKGIFCICESRELKERMA